MYMTWRWKFDYLWIAVVELEALPWCDHQEGLRAWHLDKLAKERYHNNFASFDTTPDYILYSRLKRLDGQQITHTRSTLKNLIWLFFYKEKFQIFLALIFELFPISLYTGHCISSRRLMEFKIGHSPSFSLYITICLICRKSWSFEFVERE